MGRKDWEPGAWRWREGAVAAYIPRGLGGRAGCPGGETVFDDGVIAPLSSARCIGLDVRVLVGSR
jgi:hypothetical protein